MKIHNSVFGLPGFFGRAMAPKIHLAQSPVHHPGTSHILSIFQVCTHWFHKHWTLPCIDPALICTFSLHVVTTVTDDDVMTASTISTDGGSNVGLQAWLGISLVIIIILIASIVALAVVVYLGHRKNKMGSFTPPQVSPSREVEIDLAKEQ